MPEIAEIPETKKDNTNTPPEGVLDDTQGNVMNTPEKPEQNPEEILSWTETMDFIVSPIIAWILKVDDTLIELSEREKLKLISIERKCGVTFAFNSPAYFFAMLGITYIRKIRFAVILRNADKNKLMEVEKIKKENKELHKANEKATAGKTTNQEPKAP